MGPERTLVRWPRTIVHCWATTAGAWAGGRETVIAPAVTELRAHASLPSQSQGNKSYSLRYWERPGKHNRHKSEEAKQVLHTSGEGSRHRKPSPGHTARARRHRHSLSVSHRRPTEHNRRGKGKPKNIQMVKNKTNSEIHCPTLQGKMGWLFKKRKQITMCDGLLLSLLQNLQ